MSPIDIRPLRVAVLAAAMALLGACEHHEAPAPEPEPAVSGAVVSFPGQKDPPGIRFAQISTDAQRTVSVPARLIWDEDRTSRVWAPFGGRIERLRAEVGQSVRRGDRLADIASGDVGQAQSDAQKAQTDLRLSQAGAERARELAAGGVIAIKDLQQAEADLDRARSEATRARARLSQYGVGMQSVNQSLALAAPLSGTVVERNANPGTEVRSDVQGPPLFVISDTASLWAALDVNEALLSLFKPGQKFQLRTPAWPDEVFEGEVLTVADAVDPASRTVKVRARVPNRDRKLKGEMFATASLQMPATQPMVPTDAVFLRGEKTFLFVQIAPGRYERREVSVRPAGPQSWMVLNGVKPGERVVVGGGLFLNQLMDAS